MDKELIERLAKEAGIHFHPGWGTAFTGNVQLAKLIALVAEECIKDAEYFKRRPDGSTFRGTTDSVIDLIAAAIRAKFPSVEKTVVFDNPSYAQWLRDNPPLGGV